MRNFYRNCTQMPAFGRRLSVVRLQDEWSQQGWAGGDRTPAQGQDFSVSVSVRVSSHAKFGGREAREWIIKTFQWCSNNLRVLWSLALLMLSLCFFAGCCDESFVWSQRFYLRNVSYVNVNRVDGCFCHSEDRRVESGMLCVILALWSCSVLA